MIFFDGAETMRYLTWERFKQRTKSAGGLLITAHREGMLPTLVKCSTNIGLTKPAGGLLITAHREGMLPTLVKCSTNIGLLNEIVNEILGDNSHALHETTQVLFDNHDGNLRDVLRELYDIYAARSEGRR
jgi:hypothetical protein